MKQNHDVKPRKAKREERRAADEEAERQASAYVRTVLERLNDTSCLPPRDARPSLVSSNQSTSQSTAPSVASHRSPSIEQRWMPS
jgi:hypothetical protein